MITIATITQINNKDKATLVREIINTNFVNLNNEVSSVITDLAELNSKIGELDKLKTYIKTSIVNSINYLTEEIKLLETGPAIIKEPISPNYSYARATPISAATKDHFIINGGFGATSSDSYSQKFGSFNNEMTYNGLLPVTSKNISGFYPHGFSFNGYAVFPCNSTYINYFDNNLTFKTITATNFGGVGPSGACTDSHIVMWGGVGELGAVSISTDFVTTLLGTASLSSAGATCVGNSIIFFGGFSGSTPQKSIFRYDENNVRTTLGNMKTGSSVPIGSTIKVPNYYGVFGGGLSQTNQIINDVYSMSDAFVLGQLSPFNYTHYMGSSVSTGRFALFAGGRDNLTAVGTNSVEKYNARLTHDYDAPNMNTGRYDFAGNSFGKKAIFACGRTTNSNTLTRSLEVYREVSIG